MTKEEQMRALLRLAQEISIGTSQVGDGDIQAGAEMLIDTISNRLKPVFPISVGTYGEPVVDPSLIEQLKKYTGGRNDP